MLESTFILAFYGGGAFACIGKPDARPALVAEVCQIVETQMLPLGVTAIEVCRA